MEEEGRKESKTNLPEGLLVLLVSPRLASKLFCMPATAAPRDPTLHGTSNVTA